MKIHNALGVLETLDTLAVALSDHQHPWTPRERTLYEETVGYLLEETGGQREHITTSVNCWCEPEVMKVNP